MYELQLLKCHTWIDVRSCKIYRRTVFDPKSKTPPKVPLFKKSSYKCTPSAMFYPSVGNSKCVCVCVCSQFVSHICASVVHVINQYRGGFSATASHRMLQANLGIIFEQNIIMCCHKFQTVANFTYSQIDSVLSLFILQFGCFVKLGYNLQYGEIKEQG